MKALKTDTASIFSMVFTIDGERREIRKMCSSYIIESEASNVGRKIKTDIEIWHHPYYDKPRRLTTLVFKNSKKY